MGPGASGDGVGLGLGGLDGVGVGSGTAPEGAGVGDGCWAIRATGLATPVGLQKPGGAEEGSPEGAAEDG